MKGKHYSMEIMGEYFKGIVRINAEKCEGDFSRNSLEEEVLGRIPKESIQDL